MKFEKFSYKILFTIFFFAIAGIIFFLKIGNKDIPKVSATWWNSFWNYRRSITISNSTGSSQNNAFVRILNNYNLSSLISAGKLQSDLDDLRFTDSNNNLLSYWIQDSTSTSVDIWVSIPSFPASDTYIWMYYGNSTAASGKTASLYSYTSSNQFIDDGNSFRIKFLNSGTFTSYFNITTDVFLVGGGGSGYTWYGSTGAGGGGGGYTATIHNVNITNTSYSITIGVGGNGTSGGTTTAFNNSAAGGAGGGSSSNGGAGGSGGGAHVSLGGVDGANGGNWLGGPAYGGAGQGTTTREFGEPSGTLYSTGGAGNPGGCDYASGGANTGNGGMGAWWECNLYGYGGSGIVVIRSTSSSLSSTPSTTEQDQTTANDIADATHCLVQESPNDSQLTISWTDNESYETGYAIQKSLNSGTWIDLTTLSANSTSYIDTSVSSNNTYQYRISPYYSGVSPNNWCYTSTLNLGQGNFNFQGLNLEGVNLD